ncbi:hypothetical protein [Nitratireductor aestuarii]|uniref:hypothetical protein n=1 Tax=Nitratireductor aestuarii TaxID=1735103 RepID=UPI0016671876|nr:hypothetical protein [Nitratireductor aestuarii]
MEAMLIPALIGFVAALAVATLIRRMRQKKARRQPLAPETPQSRQHRRAMERRANKQR